jgi:iron(II)-dependent oxidoreductase
VTQQKDTRSPEAERSSAVPSAQLIDWVGDARQRTCELVADLSDDQLIGPRLPIVNPLLWEIGHVAWFQEKWALRHAAKRQPIRSDADALYDSSAVAHDTRWDLPLPDRNATLRYGQQVSDRVQEWLAEHEPGADAAYFTLLSIFHADMHTEAFTYARQTLGYPPPRLDLPRQDGDDRGAPLHGDAIVPGGTFELGGRKDQPFVFDNEKWAHPVELLPFAIARVPVTQREFAAFVDDGGYREPRFWSEAGWRWRTEVGAEQPVYWQREAAGRWLRRDFDRWVGLEPDRPVLHVSWYEAEAYCRWAGRRLPTEREWEAAAASERDQSSGRSACSKSDFPWGDSVPGTTRAHLDWARMGCIDVHALPEGDSALGCRQMIGNVWEWTADDFLPFPGFVADPYKEYSEPWFGTHKVLRGGCWATRSRLIRNTWRNFYRPERRDVWAGFRTCAQPS